METKIEDLKKELLALDRCDDVLGLTETEAIRRKEIAANIIITSNNRKSLLHQKARLNWLRDGDVNSRLFHRAIARRRNLNGMAGLEIGGNWVENPDSIKREVLRHFSEHFQGNRGLRFRMHEDFNAAKLNDRESEGLIQPFSTDEVKNAVWDCYSDKSPGPDGFNFSFLKGCWEVIKEDFCRTMHEFFANERIGKGCNSSFIVLIPKNEGARELNHFRPISLIGCLYKVIAKVLARRIRPVMGKLIGDAQSAFLPGRNIMDGIAILNEVIEDAKRKNTRRIVFKVDFAKAYDSMEWDFLMDMMARMNFPRKWRDWILECVSSATANVLVNGSPSGEFRLERGVRQGDPLSPFLFLITAEGLNLLINRAIERGLIQPAEVGSERIKISHLQYADDTLFVVEGSFENVKAIKWLLKFLNCSPV